MLNIPDEVKALFSSDTVKKNFHVRFPNGEYTDLNNENLISESVNFTESLCSQQYFKFGLAEASQIEFTAVGIPNVRGAYIEAAIEIDCTRLGAEWAANNPVDDTLPFLDPQTCEYDSRIYYRVPYGRFKVDTCPRNHGAMWQRQITAYSEIIQSNEQMSPFEISILNLSLGNNKKFEPNLMRMVFANVGYFRPGMMSRYGFEETLVKAWTGTYTVSAYFTISCFPLIQLKIEYTLEEKTLQEVDGLDKLYKFDVGEYDFAAFEAMVDYLDSNYTVQTPGYTSVREYLKDRQFYPSVHFSYSPQTIWGYESYWPDIDITNGLPCFYPYRSTGGTFIMYFHLYDTIKVTEIKNGVSTVLFDLDFRPGITTAAIYEWEQTSPTAIDDVTLSFEPTLKTKRTTSSGKTYTGYSYANAFSYTDIMKGFMELCGWFLKPNRTGSINFFQMVENPTAIPVPTSDWSEFWWDETPVESIGEVVIIYEQDDKSKKDQQQQTIAIGDGNSVYTIKDNAVLKSANLTQAQAEAIINTYFAPNASVVNFTPVELSMRGLPYLESGDYIELTAEDGETVETYILSQTISGIQHLTAEVTSTNGALLEVINNE